MGYSNSLEPKKFPKVKFFWAGFIVLVVAVVIFIVFFLIGKGGEDFGDKYPACAELEGDSQIRCIVSKGLGNKDVGVCEEEFSDKKIFNVVSHQGGERLMASANDYCWNVLGEISGMDYCDKILDVSLKELCENRGQEV